MDIDDPTRFLKTLPSVNAHYHFFCLFHNLS